MRGVRSPVIIHIYRYTPTNPPNPPPESERPIPKTPDEISKTPGKKVESPDKRATTWYSSGMATVTCKNQPAIHATKGHVPLSATKRPYTVNKVLWPRDVETWVSERLIGATLHICFGKSRLGDCRLDLHEPGADVRGDAAKLPFGDRSWDTVLIDPSYNGVFRWNHDMLSELARVGR